MKKAIIICLVLTVTSCNKTWIADGQVFFRKGIPAPNAKVRFTWGLHGTTAYVDDEVTVTSGPDGKFVMEHSVGSGNDLVYIYVDSDSGGIQVTSGILYNQRNIKGLELIIKK